MKYELVSAVKVATHDERLLKIKEVIEGLQKEFIRPSTRLNWVLKELEEMGAASE